MVALMGPGRRIIDRGTQAVIDQRTKTSLCKGCQKPIVWAKSSEGKMIPIDPRPPIYAYSTEGGETVARRVFAHGVSHFATCPNADNFSGSKKG